jgi:hypothetical protein
VNDELQTDEWNHNYDLCLETSGLMTGEFSDGWSPGAPPFNLKLEGNRVISSKCDGFLNGEWEDGWNPGHKYKICMDGMSVSTSGGAFGSWSFPKLSMNIGGTVVTATKNSAGDTLTWANGNTWRKVAGSEYASGATIDGGTLTWHFWTGTDTATVNGDRLQWSSGNVWTKTSGNSLSMARCNGEKNQKWAYADPGEIKSLADDITCVSTSSTPGAASVTKCGTGSTSTRLFTKRLYGPEIDITEA